MGFLLPEQLISQRYEIPWWAWRRRAARLRFLEHLARTEFRVCVDGFPNTATTFELCYRSAVRDGSLDIVRGLAFTDLAHIAVGSPDAEHDHSTDHCITLSLRLPIAVDL